MLSGPNIGVWMEEGRENQPNTTTTAAADNNNGGDEINPLTSYKSMLEVEEDANNWFLPQHNNHENSLPFSPNNLLLQSVDAASSCSPSAALFHNIDPNNPQYFLTQKPTMPSLLNPISENALEPNFDMETGFLAMNRGTEGLHGYDELGSHTQVGVSNLTSDPHFSTSHLPRSPGNGFGSPSFSGLRPLDNFASTGAQPTLFQKRAALRRNPSDTNSGGGGNLGGLDDGVNENKRKRSDGSWDDVDNMSFDGSGLNYDSDEFTEYTNSKFEEIGIKIGGGDTSNANSTVTGGGPGGADQKGKKKGMPAKNLMAERRRRKKLNDRLYMLRSVVPKISKMDRASILGDAIEYLKELLQRINDLNHELESTPSSSSLTPTTANGFYPLTPTATTIPSCIKEEVFPSTLPSPTGQPVRVEVRQREGGAVNIHMFCSRRPGLLLSTMRALDNLGLDVQQAVISCFNGFALDVFLAEQCNEGQDVHPDQIKAMLLESAGYHGVA